MASKTNQIADLSEHRRKIFFERLSPNTTTDSLKQYLEAFDVDFCNVQWKEGRSCCYGSVVFRKESSVNSVMSRRPLRIEGKSVEVYRSVPDQGPLKEKKGIRYLIVSGFRKGSFTESDLKDYFNGFGDIIKIEMNDNQDSCCIEFDDYDPVDKALLDQPHKIKKIEVTLTKGNRIGRWNSNPSIRPSQPTAAPTKSIL